MPPADEDGLVDEEEAEDGLVDEDDGLLDEDDGVLDDDDGLLDDDDGLLDDEEDCATANVDSAKSTAAVVMLRVLGMNRASGWWVVWKPAPNDVQALCRARRRFPFGRIAARFKL